MAPHFPKFLLPLAILGLPFTPAHSQSQGNLSGVWSFDTARVHVFTHSLKKSILPEAPRGEIAAAMGVARAENSLYEIGAERDGPFLSITDKTTRIPVVYLVTVEKSPTELILTVRDSGHRYRLRPLDPKRLDLIDEQKQVVIPLTRG